MINVILIAGGPSLKDYEIWNHDFRSPTNLVIGTNDAGIRLNVDIVLTMDRLWLENRQSHINLDNKIWHVRRDVVKNIPEDLRPYLNTFVCDYKTSFMSSDPKVLNGTNSGTCSINLAYQKEPKTVYLLGYDMCKSDGGEPYWYPSYPWAKVEGGTSSGKYNAWAKEFLDIKKQFDAKKIEIVNVNHRSQIKCFRTLNFKDFLKEIK